MSIYPLTDLGEIKKDIVSGKDQTIKNFVSEVVRAIDNHLWCYFPQAPDKEEAQAALVEYKGKIMIAAYSSAESEKIAPDMIITDINKVIDMMYSDKDIRGIVFDLNDFPIEVTRQDISVLSNRQDERLQHKDWGNGIPKYSSEDLLTKDELFDFGVAAAMHQMNEEGYSIVHAVYNYRSVLNIIAVKDYTSYFICVKTAIAPEIPRMTLKEINELKAVCKKEKTLPLFVPIIIGSTDSERFDASLALIGDDFDYGYMGVKTIEID